jgi:acyl-CoA dehydrogenase
MAIPVLPPPSAKAVEIGERVKAFLEEHIIPAEHTYHRQLDEGPDRWTVPPVMDELKAKAKKAGLWNLFLPKKHFPDSLTNLEYASICETMGRSPIGGEPFNCSAPDTGNMETLILYATAEQKKKWLEPLMSGEIRSAFAMTEPAVASSDATNIRSSIKRDGDHYVINGRKWWTSGAPDKRCKIMIFMGQTDPSAGSAQAPVDGAGADGRARRHDDALAQRDGLRRRAARTWRGRLQGRARAGVEHPARRGPRLRDRAGRLGPGRIHHCMRTIGLAERTLESLCQRAMSRTAFGKTIAEQGVTRQWIAEVAHGDRSVAAAHTLRRAHDGHGRQQGSAPRDRDDQGGGAEDGAEAGRPRHPGARRRRRVTGFPARLCVCAHAHDADRGWTGCGARGSGGRSELRKYQDQSQKKK